MDWGSFLNGFGVGASMAIVAIGLEVYRIWEPRKRRQRDLVRRAESQLRELRGQVEGIYDVIHLSADDQRSPKDTPTISLGILTNEPELPRDMHNHILDVVNDFKQLREWSGDALQLIRSRVDTALEYEARLSEMWEPFGFGALADRLYSGIVPLAFRKEVAAESVRTPLLDQFGRGILSPDKNTRLRDVFDSNAFHAFIGRVQQVQKSPTLQQVRVLREQLLGKLG